MLLQVQRSTAYKMVQPLGAPGARLRRCAMYCIFILGDGPYVEPWLKPHGLASGRAANVPRSIADN